MFQNHYSLKSFLNTFKEKKYNDNWSISKILTTEKEKNMSKDKNVSETETMNNYFINILKTLNLKPSKNYQSKVNKKNDIMRLLSQFDDLVKH